MRCWFAQEDLKIGDKFRHRIDESIRIYDKLLLILTEISLASTWVSYEVEKALDKEPEGVPNVLFPIRLDKTILTCDTDWAKEIRKSRPPPSSSATVLDTISDARGPCSRATSTAIAASSPA